MKANNILLIFALLLVANATNTNFEFASFAEVSNLTTSKYGKSLVETISLALENGGDVSSVQKLLDSLLFTLNKDQEKADEDWKTENTRLVAKIALLTKQIAALQKDIDELDDELKRYQKLLVQVGKNLVQYKGQVADNNKQIGEVQKDRKEDEADFKTSQSEHLDIVNAIETVVVELTKLVGSISGNGKPAHVDAIAQETRDAAFEAAANKKDIVPTTKADIVKDIATSFLQFSQNDEETNLFVQMATSADQNALNKLIKTLNTLKESTQRSFNDDKSAEARSKKSFAELMISLVADNKKLGKMIGTSNKHMVEYGAKVQKLKTEIIAKTKLRDAKSAEKKATADERNVKEKQYNDEKADRSEEVSVVERLQKIVLTRLATMSKYLKEATA
jgi:hypothetical protein